jgi:hypothetical protein
MAFTTSPNMNLPVPNVGSEPGPQYAADVNNCMGLIDQHNHAFGNGVQINPDGLNINSDLTIQGNNLTNVKSVIFSSQPSPITGSSPYLGALYEVLNDLYYNDGIGNQIRLTQGGSIVGTSGSITGLVSPASATYSPGSSTFTWESDVSTPATMDMGNIIIRNDTASSPGVTIAPNASIASNYQITLPAALPGSTQFVTLDSSGNFIANTAVSHGLTQSMKAIRATGSTVAAGGYATSTATTTYTTSATSGSPATVTGLSVTITTTGNPVQLSLQVNPTFQGFVGISNNGADTSMGGDIIFLRGATSLCDQHIEQASGGSTSSILNVTPSTFMFIDTPTAGTYTYTVQAYVDTGSTVMTIFNTILTAYEL